MTNKVKRLQNYCFIKPLNCGFSLSETETMVESEQVEEISKVEDTTEKTESKS